MLNYLEENPEIFFRAFLLVLLCSVVLFFFGGRKAEASFRANSDQEIVFREKGAAGHSKKSLFTRLGGASKVLDVAVTDRELWIKGIWPIFTYIGTKYDLTHRIPLEDVTFVEAKGGRLRSGLEM